MPVRATSQVSLIAPKVVIVPVAPKTIWFRCSDVADGDRVCRKEAAFKTPVGVSRAGWTF